MPTNTKPSSTPLDPRTADLMRRSIHVDGTDVHITAGDLTRDEYQALDKVLRNLGGRWTGRKGKGGRHVFPFQARAAIAEVLASGLVPLAAKNADGYVATPPQVVQEILDLPGASIRQLPSGASVLEPSAGDGAILRELLGLRSDLLVTAIEPNEWRRGMWSFLPYEHKHAGTFEEYAAANPAARFDAVVMNPPFSVPGNRTIWIDHVRLGFGRLKPGGVLIAIVPASFAHNISRAHEDMRAMVDAYGGWRALPDDAFAPLKVPTVVLWLHAPMVTRPAQVPARLEHWHAPVYTGREVPVRVPRPQFSRAARTTMQVQVYYDGWTARDRVMRYLGDCVNCGRVTWAFDDGHNDPRGILGQHAADVQDPAEDGMVGPRIAACFECTNDGRDTYEKIRQTALKQWTYPEEVKVEQQTDTQTDTQPVGETDRPQDDRPGIEDAKREHRVAAFASKLYAETLGLEVPRWVEPTDQVLAGCFENCAKPAPADLYPQIRERFLDMARKSLRAVIPGQLKLWMRVLCEDGQVRTFTTISNEGVGLFDDGAYVSPHGQWWLIEQLPAPKGETTCGGDEPHDPHGFTGESMSTGQVTAYRCRGLVLPSTLGALRAELARLRWTLKNNPQWRDSPEQAERKAWIDTAVRVHQLEEQETRLVDAGVVDVGADVAAQLAELPAKPVTEFADLSELLAAWAAV